MNRIKHSKNIKKISILLSFVIIVFVIMIIFSKNFDRNNNNRLNTDKTFEEINISEYRIETIFEKNIKNRITKKLDHNLFIGETDKQIGNGYYDVKAYIQNNKCIVVCLNKLWKEFDSSLYEENYIKEIVESIEDILAINIPQNEFYDYILTGYLEAKNSNNNSNYKKEYILDLDKFVIKGEVLEKEFVMSIYKMSKKGSGKCE